MGPVRTTSTSKQFRACIFGVALALCTSLVQSRAPAPQETVATIAVAELPSQGRVTYRLIHEGGPFPYEKDGTVFGNRERLLPNRQRGYYREYTVKTAGIRHRGANRIVCGGPPQTPDGCYYTNDHYASFRKIVE
ncbi:ribonuclease domain-containing protein [Variovorax sp. HJSM1_2]|uniref:ribonuclease domain-containing protein n=1 Tax=Variovorax sp. HJSM1_2 TaxID=3366263 RepID=UPI003BBD4A6F